MELFRDRRADGQKDIQAIIRKDSWTDKQPLGKYGKLQRGVFHNAYKKVSSPYFVRIQVASQNASQK